MPREAESLGTLTYINTSSPATLSIPGQTGKKRNKTQRTRGEKGWQREAEHRVRELPVQSPGPAGGGNETQREDMSSQETHSSRQSA